MNRLPDYCDLVSSRLTIAEILPGVHALFVTDTMTKERLEAVPFSHDWHMEYSEVCAHSYAATLREFSYYYSQSGPSSGTPASTAMFFGSRSLTSCYSPSWRDSSPKLSVPLVLEPKRSWIDWPITLTTYHLIGWTTTRTLIPQWTPPKTFPSSRGHIPG